MKFFKMLILNYIVISYLVEQPTIFTLIWYNGRLPQRVISETRWEHGENLERIMKSCLEVDSRISSRTAGLFWQHFWILGKKKILYRKVGQARVKLEKCGHRVGTVFCWESMFLAVYFGNNQISIQSGALYSMFAL